ncbi:hypothetical protein IEO21_07588 [Rhodonia placenta]|uniref:Amidohydrolase 3 domain-containing protein n=1 Tax=Rhodonia placenta TaxID=104341 RepID=A0A8H7NYA2_9APHY|nr:hypothetical protein IEO21_07588 [Postia placenta]
MPPSPDDPTSLRRRQPSEEKILADAPRSVETAAPDPSQSTNIPAVPTRLGVSRGIISIILAILTLSVYRLCPRSLPAVPKSYVLCSRDGDYIYTVDDAHPRVQCLAVHQSRFVAAGSLPEVQDAWRQLVLASEHVHIGFPSSLPVRHIGPGQIIVPGLSDSHAHILEYGAMKQIPLEGTHTVQETVKHIREYILSNPDIRDDPSKFVEGWGWDHTQWLSATWPTADDLDRDSVVRGRPVVLQSKDGHALWVSSTVIKSMEPMPEDVPGGVIMRDDSGNPTGVFLDNAQDLVVLPEPSHETLDRRFAATVKDALALGLTSIHDAGFNPRSLEFFQKQAEDRKLPIRIYGMTYFDENAEYWGNTSHKVMGEGDNRLWARSVKIFADGALRSGGAALYEPYADNPSTRGFMRIEPEILNKVIPQFMRDGWQVNVHAIGDRANGVVLDAFEEALKEANVTALRPRLEHAQILTEADMARFGDLGVIASIQPTHVISDMWFGEERLGPERVKGLYAFRSILDHGARITLGSDFPVENINPFASFYAAITRLSPDGKSPHGTGGWFPEQRMTREEALRGMTIDPAYASFTEGSLGSITLGKHADYVVLSQDIMSVPAERILDTSVVATVMDGRPAYGSI